MKQLGAWSMLGIWAALCLGGALYASWMGYGGPGFAATLTVFAFLLLAMTGLAARGVADGITQKFGAGGGVFLGACVFVAYLAYLLGAGGFSLARVGVMAGLIFVPLGLAVTAEGAAPGAWQDFLTIVGIWAFVKFGPLAWLWPYPGGRLAHVLTVLVAMDVALAAFLVVRRTKGVGYTIGWGKGWGLKIIVSFAVFAVVAIPLGLKMRFLQFAPRWNEWRSFLALAVTILVLTAWPEELLFRGLLQNVLSRASKSDLAGWWTASMLFGFSHITNMGFPNWRYVILASIAGLCYGWTWRRTGSILPAALLHGAVDVTWHFLFRS
ncbi:MAG TPA: type II CAAX endopeptidase family protein [Candidatus Acidoferrum sp.]